MQVQLPDAASLAARPPPSCTKSTDILAHLHGVQAYDGIAGFSLLSNTSSIVQRLLLRRLRSVGRAPRSLNCPANALVLQHQPCNWPRQIPEADRLRLRRRPPFPGLGTAGRLHASCLQDRTGGTVEQLYDRRLEKLHRPSGPQAPGLVGAWSARSGHRRPELYVDVDQDRVLKQGLQFSRRLPDCCRPFLAQRRHTSTSSTASAASGRCTGRP